MKLSRVLAATAGVALVGASTFAFAAPASAEDITAPQGADFPSENDFDSYPAGWFLGASGSTVENLDNSEYGLDLTAPTDTTQILNGTPVTGSLSELVGSAALWVTRGEASFQIPVFGEPEGDDQQFTTLRPVAASTPGDAYFGFDSQWITSQAIGDAYAAGDIDTIANFEDALNEGEPLQILAFGAAIGTGTTASIGSIDFAGNSHLFRAAPTGTYIPDTITVSALATTGISIDIAGFVPGEPVYIGLGTEGFGDAFNDAEYVAAADGTFVTTATTSSWEPNTYTLSVFGGFSGDRLEGTLTITADAAPAAVVPVLAATGTDLSTGVIAGGVLLLAGAGFAMFATRRRFGNQA